VVPYRDIKRGDIVVFLSPAEAGLYVVKRIRGVPGDHIRLRDGKLYVNGQLQDEPFVHPHNGSSIPYRDNFPAVPPNELSGLTAQWAQELPSHIQDGELVVPPGSYFAMGDNRDVSYDSRFWGFIPRQNIIGRPLAIYWSFEATSDEYTQTALGDRFLSLLHSAIHFFDKTRWRRTLQMVR
jgi:signal peptidase I